MDPLIQPDRQALLDLAARHGVTHLRAFGSMARGDAGGSAHGRAGPTGTAGRCRLGAGTHRGPARAHPGGGRAAVRPTPDSDGEHIAHMLGCITAIRDYTQGKRAIFDGSSLVQDAVLRKLKTMTESSQRPSGGPRSARWAPLPSRAGTTPGPTSATPGPRVGPSACSAILKAASSSWMPWLRAYTESPAKHRHAKRSQPPCPHPSSILTLPPYSRPLALARGTSSSRPASTMPTRSASPRPPSLPVSAMRSSTIG